MNPALTRHLKGRSVTELIEDAEQVERLMGHPGFRVVEELIAAEIATIDKALDGAVLGNVQEYAYTHGRRGGLRAFADAAREIIREAKTRQAQADAKAEQVAA